MWGVNALLHLFLTLALYENEWLASRPGRFTAGKVPRYPLNRRLKIPTIKIQNTPNALNAIQSLFVITCKIALEV
jgi:hypothetical protein